MEAPERPRRERPPSVDERPARRRAMTAPDGAATPIRVAVVQTGPAGEDLQTELERAAEAVDQVPEGTRLILFPELFARPFWCVGLADRAYFDWAESLEGPTISAMADAARRSGAYLAVPFF